MVLGAHFTSTALGASTVDGTVRPAACPDYITKASGSYDPRTHLKRSLAASDLISAICQCQPQRAGMEPGIFPTVPFNCVSSTLTNLGNDGLTSLIKVSPWERP